MVTLSGMSSARKGAMRFLFVLLAILFAASIRAENLIMVKPMMPQDIVVELKSGLSPADVAADVQQHRLARSPLAEELKAMQDAGATPQLLSLVQSTAILADANDATLAKLDEAAKQKRIELAKRPQFWIYAELKGRYPDGSVLATCQCPLPVEKPSALQRATDAWIHFAKPPPPFKTPDGRYFINCEAAFLGQFQGTTPDGKPFTAADLEMVKNLGPLSPVRENSNAATTVLPSAANRPPLRIGAKIPFNQWLNLRAYGGPDIRVHIYSLDSSAIRLRFDGWSGPKELPITSGRDAKTLLFDDGTGCTVFYVDAMDRPDDAVVLEFDHTSSSATYPQVKPTSEN